MQRDLLQQTQQKGCSFNMQDTTITAEQKKKALSIAIKVLVVAVILVAGYFIIKMLVNRTTPMDPQMKAQVDSLKRDMQMLKRANVELSKRNEALQQTIDEKENRGDAIRQEISKNESRRVNIPKEYEKISNSVDTWSDASIDSFLAARYGHK
jgi:predicted nuclease with TOPRIM domain